MKIFKELKNRELVENEKEYSELVWLRMIKINDKVIEHPRHELNEKISKIQVGILEIEI